MDSDGLSCGVGLFLSKDVTVSLQISSINHIDVLVSNVGNSDPA